MQANHFGGIEELGILYIGLATATLSAAFVWLYLMALEPFVRRLWPELLISWTRLLDGRFRDSRVGRDLLVGMVAGTLGHACVLTDWLLSPAAPRIPSLPFTLLGPATLTGEVLLVHLDAIDHSLVVLVLLLVARLVLRSELRAAVCSAILWTMAQGLLNNAPLAGWLFIGLTVSLGIAVLVRFGLVAYIAAVFAFDVLRLPVTTDTTAFYFGNGLVAMTLVAVIALYGLNASLGRRSLFGNVAKAR